MTLSFALMAHPQREGYVEELLPQLDREPVVVWDEVGSRWDTGRRSLLSYDPSCTHHFVVQDDAVVPRDLCAGIERALEYVSPQVPVCLYTGRSRPNAVLVTRAMDQARERDCTWLRMPGPWWGVGVVTPTVAIEQMVADCDKMSHIPNYDLRMAEWWTNQGIMCLYSIPSLVDHRAGPSLVWGRGSAGRYAHTALGPDQSALDTDWNTSCLNVYTISKDTKGDLKVVDPHGKTHNVSAKAFRNLVDKGWSIAPEESVEAVHAKA